MECIFDSIKFCMAVYVRVEEHYINTNPFTNVMPPEGLIALGNE